jgi:uncharacterized protein (DUF169 family)
MEAGFKSLFTQKWSTYFPDAPLPISLYYADHEEHAFSMQPHEGGHCLIKELARVRAGESLSFEGQAIGCFGGRYYVGFSEHLRPDFNFFLSCGIPGQLEGERYKATPALVDEQMRQHPSFKAPSKMIVFKRWDKLEEDDQPQVVIFFESPDVISGLFALANFDAHGNQSVIAPAASGCASTIQYPMNELKSVEPRGILGMFDVSARPWVPPGELTLALPWPKFTRMVANMDESFLITEAWQRLRSRLPQV